MRGVPGFRDFRKQLTLRQLAPGYIFLGPEGYLVTEAITALRAALLTDDFTTLTNLPTDDGAVLADSLTWEVLSRTHGNATGPRLTLAEIPAQQEKLRAAQQAIESFDYAGYQGRETELDQVLLQIRTPPMLVRRRLVVVRDFDKYRKEGQEQLLTELAKQSPVCRLVLTAESVNVATERLITATGCAKFVIAVANLSHDDKLQFVERCAGRQQMKLSPDAKLLLLETCGDSLGQLKSELEKLKTFLGPQGLAESVTRETVRSLAGHWREYEISEFVDAVAKRNRPQALSNLRRLMDWNEEPVKIVGWLSGRYLRMLASAYGDAQLWTRAEIVLALQHLSRIDLRLKTGYPEKYYLLEDFVIRRTARRQAARNKAQATGDN